MVRPSSHRLAVVVVRCGIWISRDLSRWSRLAEVFAERAAAIDVPLKFLPRSRQGLDHVDLQEAPNSKGEHLKRHRFEVLLHCLPELGCRWCPTLLHLLVRELEEM